MARYFRYRRRAVLEMRPYEPGEDTRGLSREPVPRLMPEPMRRGGMIARDPMRPSVQWYVGPDRFESEFERVGFDERVAECAE